jgi:hypothetical protein
MTRTAKHAALAVLLASAAAWGYAQDLLPTDWPTQFRDAANTSSTPVLPPDTIAPAWEHIQTTALENPRVYFTTGGEQVLISGNNIYQASHGTWLRSLPYQARYGYAAITTTTISGQSTDVLLNGDGTHFEAYDLGKLLNNDPNADQPLWSLDIPVDPERDPSLGRCHHPTARDGVFYLATSADEWIARVDAASGSVLWKNYPGAWIESGTPAVATINSHERVFLTTFGCGLFALDAVTLEVIWQRADIGSYVQCCVDEGRGVLYVHNTLNGETLEARDAADGSPLWSAPLDHILNEPPTLGWAKDGDGNLHPAVFVVTGGVDNVADVYAFRRDKAGDPNKQLLWHTTIPSDAWVAAVYCGCTGPGDPRDGRLYIATNNYGADSADPGHGDTYVLEAFTGEQLRVLGTDSLDPRSKNVCPVIVDVGGAPYMYVLTALGRIMAWKQDGGLPLPVYQLSIEVSPSQISTNGSATITATFVNVADPSSPAPVPGVSICFYGSFAQNQGYIDPRTVVTDNEGKATTKLYSQNRTGVVSIGARTPNGIVATTTITITKGGQAPPTTGSIQGTVYYVASGKPARNATVDLWSWEEAGFVDHTTTNARGKYSFQGVPFGWYTVLASANGASGSTDVEISQQSPSVTGVDVSLE